METKTFSEVRKIFPHPDDPRTHGEWGIGWATDEECWEVVEIQHPGMQAQALRHLSRRVANRGPKGRISG